MDVTKLPKTKTVSGKVEFVCPVCREVLLEEDNVLSCPCGYTWRIAEMDRFTQGKFRYLGALRDLRNAIDKHIEVYDGQDFMSPSWHKECAVSWTSVEETVTAVINLNGTGIAMRI